MERGLGAQARQQGSEFLFLCCFEIFVMHSFKVYIDSTVQIEKLEHCIDDENTDFLELAQESAFTSAMSLCLSIWTRFSFSETLLDLCEVVKLKSIISVSIFLTLDFWIHSNTDLNNYCHSKFC